MKEIILEVVVNKEINSNEALEIAMQSVKDAMLESIYNANITIFEVDVKAMLKNMIDDKDSLVKIKDVTQERLFGISEVASELLEELEELEEYEDIENESTLQLMQMLNTIFE